MLTVAFHYRCWIGTTTREHVILPGRVHGALCLLREQIDLFVNIIRLGFVVW